MIKKIFEIKIYPWSPEEFSKKVKKHQENFYLNNEYESDIKRQEMYSIFYGRKISYADYSIGYLEIIYNFGCLEYCVNIMRSKKYASMKEIKRYINNLDDESYPCLDLKIDKARSVLGFSLRPYIPKLFTEKKHYMIARHVGGAYTPILNKTNAEIVEAIYAEIERIRHSDEYKKLYFDTSLFDTIGGYIDFTKLINGIKKQKKCGV